MPPLDPARFASRKALSHAVWRAVADGASTLRQNRPVPDIRDRSRTTMAEPAYG